MLSEDLALVINAFDKTILPSVEAECPRTIQVSARICRVNLADILDRLREMEQSTAPRLMAPPADNVVALRRRPRPLPTNPDGGDAA